MKALEDPHMQVRTTAIEVLDDATDDFITMLCGWLIGNAGSPRAQKAILSYLEQHPVPESVLWEIIVAKADDALEIASVLHQLEKHFADKTTPASWQLLKVTLEERKKQIINLALQALERVEPKETIRMISAGVNSKDQRSFANAVEALSNIRNKDVVKKLINLFEGELDHKNGALSGAEGVNAEAIFQWCTTRPDPWLRECIGYVKSKLAQERVAYA